MVFGPSICSAEVLASRFAEVPRIRPKNPKAKRNSLQPTTDSFRPKIPRRSAHSLQPTQQRQVRRNDK